MKVNMSVEHVSLIADGYFVAVIPDIPMSQQWTEEEAKQKMNQIEEALEFSTRYKDRYFTPERYEITADRNIIRITAFNGDDKISLEITDPKFVLAWDIVNNPQLLLQTNVEQARRNATIEANRQKRIKELEEDQEKYPMDWTDEDSANLAELKNLERTEP